MHFSEKKEGKAAKAKQGTIGERRSMITIAVLIALGGLLDADRIAETLRKIVTDMNPGPCIDSQSK